MLAPTWGCEWVLASAWGCEPRRMWIYPWIINFDLVRTARDRSGGRGCNAVLTPAVRLGSLEGFAVGGL